MHECSFPFLVCRRNKVASGREVGPSEIPEARRPELRVPGPVLDIPVPEKGLQRARVVTLIC